MKMNEAKQAAYSAAHRAARATETLLKWDHQATPEEAEDLVSMARQLNGAALEIQARVTGQPEAKQG